MRYERIIESMTGNAVYSEDNARKELDTLLHEERRNFKRRANVFPSPRDTRNRTNGFRKD